MGYTVTENGSAYDRGVAAGEISARLAGHDKHFAMINGSLIDVAAEMKAMNLQLQRMSDAMQAERERAEALREASDRRWSPLMRFAAVIGALAALAGILAAILANI